VKSRSLLESFRNAADGLSHVLHKDWHMRVLFLIGAIVLLLSAFLRVTRAELLLLCVGITLVVLAEVLNSAIEAMVDLASPGFHELAKTAKDVGGAGVLVASICGVLICAGVFITADTTVALRGVTQRPAPHILHVALVGAITIIVAVVLGKLWSGSAEKLTRGGVVSAHSALAFFLFVSVAYLTKDVVSSAMAFLLAVMVAQSRVEAGIHRAREVLIGAGVALVVGVALYAVLAMRGGM
jgi:diacylglycerol kinase (ATP)